MRKLPGGVWACPDDYGRDVVELARGNARAATEAARVRPPRYTSPVASMLLNGVDLGYNPPTTYDPPYVYNPGIIDPIQNWGPQLLAWYRPSVATVTLNGADASGIQSRLTSPHALHLTQATSSRQPLYSATGGPLSNPELVLTAANLDALSATISLSRRIFSIFVVSRAATNHTGIVASLRSSALEGRIAYDASGTTITGGYYYNGIEPSVTATYTYGTGYAAIGAYVTPLKTCLAVNGTLLASANRGPVHGSPQLITNIEIGADGGTGGVALNGGVAEVIVVQDEVNPNQLAWHWAYVANWTGLFTAP